MKSRSLASFTTPLALAAALSACTAPATRGSLPPGPDGEDMLPPGHDGGSTDPGNPGAEDPVADVLPGPPGAPLFPLRLMVVINGAGSTDYATMLVLDEDGTVSASELRIPLPQSPRAVAVSPSGREYVIAHGLGPRADEGLTVIRVEAGVESASMARDVRLGSDYSPYAVMYASEDVLLLALQGPDGGRLTTLTRGADEQWVAGSLIDVGPGPRQLAPLPEADRALLFSSDLIDGGAALAVLGPGAVGWDVLERSPLVDEKPLEMAGTPDGRIVYVPLYDGSVPTRGAPRGGLLHMFERMAGTGSYAPARAPLVLPNGGLLLSVAPDASTAVVAAPDSAGRMYGLLTLELDAAGMPMHLGPAASSIPGVLMTQLAMLPGGFLLTGAVEHGGGKMLRILAREPGGGWRETDSLSLEGMVEAIAIARGSLAASGASAR